MSKVRKYGEGWFIVGWTALLIGLAIAALLLIQGINEQALRLIIQSTGKSSFVLFTAAFIASSLKQLFPANSTVKWLRRNRRYIGVSFAVSHSYHGFALLATNVVTQGQFFTQLDSLTIIGGVVGYIFIAALTITSFRVPAAWLGSKWWMRLHKVGMYYFWFVFFNSYFLEKTLSGKLFYLPFVIVIFATWLLRIFAKFYREPKFIS